MPYKFNLNREPSKSDIDLKDWKDAGFSCWWSISFAFHSKLLFLEALVLCLMFGYVRRTRLINLIHFKTHHNVSINEIFLLQYLSRCNFVFLLFQLHYFVFYFKTWSYCLNLCCKFSIPIHLKFDTDCANWT